MFSFTFSRIVAVAHERMVISRMVASLQKRGAVCQTGMAHVVCMQGTLGSMGIFRHISRIQREQSGNQVIIAFTSQQQMTIRGYLLVLTSVILALAALYAGPWFLTVELSAILCATLVAVENTHARRELLHSALEAQEAVRQL